MVQNRNNLELDIVLILLRGNTHLRGISRLLAKPHSTILRSLNMLANDNVIDFKREGRNKVFYLKNNLQTRNYVFNAERYKLIKTIKQYPELGVVISEILKKCGERLIVIFGSYAKGIAKRDSDIDIYVDTNNRKAKEEIESINSKIRIKIGNFDLDSLLIKEIVKNHIIIKGVEEFYEKIKLFE